MDRLRDELAVSVIMVNLRPFLHMLLQQVPGGDISVRSSAVEGGEFQRWLHDTGTACKVRQSPLSCSLILWPSMQAGKVFFRPHDVFPTLPYTR